MMPQKDGSREQKLTCGRRVNGMKHLWRNTSKLNKPPMKGLPSE